MAEILPDGSTIGDVVNLFEPFRSSGIPEVSQAAVELLSNLEEITASPDMSLEPQIRAIYRRHYYHLVTLQYERVSS